MVGGDGARVAPMGSVVVLVVREKSCGGARGGGRKKRSKESTAGETLIRARSESRYHEIVTAEHRQTDSSGDDRNNNNGDCRPVRVFCSYGDVDVDMVEVYGGAFVMSSSSSREGRKRSFFEGQAAVGLATCTRSSSWLGLARVPMQGRKGDAHLEGPRTTMRLSRQERRPFFSLLLKI
jgi:hypothetical protein